MKRGLMILVLVVLLVQPVLAMMPLSCDKFLNGGSQGDGYNCVLAVIAMYEGAGMWDGTWETGGYGWYPPY